MEVNMEEITFDPTQLVIKFETQKELSQFKEMIRHCDTIPDAIIDEGAEIDRDFVHDFMSKIYNNMQ